MIGACMAQGKREEAEEYKRQVAANAGRTEELSKEDPAYKKIFNN